MKGSIAGAKDNGERDGVWRSAEEIEDDRANVARTFGADDVVGDDMVLGEDREDMVVEECGAGAVSGDRNADDKDGHGGHLQLCSSAGLGVIVTVLKLHCRCYKRVIGP